MATEIKMPQLSDTMSSGKILTWRLNEGAVVKRGDILAEVETDKANLEIESFFNGTLLKVLIPAGSVAKVGEVIAVIGQPGESVGTSSSSAPQRPAQPASPAPTVAAPTAAPTAPAAPAAALTVVSSHDRVKVSPLARKVAENLQVNLSSVQGSGPNGRIVKRDVEAAAGETAPVSSAAPQLRETPAPQPATPTAVGAGSLTPLSRMREGKSVSPVTHRHGARIGVSRFEGPTKVRGPFRRYLDDPI